MFYVVFKYWLFNRNDIENRNNYMVLRVLEKKVGCSLIFKIK